MNAPLRVDSRLMDPSEMTPEERWDEIVELLALMALPRSARAAREVLTDENNSAI